MKQISIIIALLISISTASWPQNSAEVRLDAVIKTQDQAKDLKTLKQGWSAYNLGNYEAALSLWMPLAEMGNPSAQVFIGLMHNQGHAVEQNINKAVKWYALASDQGHAPAKWRLAILYYHGSGLTKDYQKAAEFFYSAAKLGDTYSQKALGLMYSKGFGIPKNNVLAYSWLNIASGNGFELASKLQNEIIKEMSPKEAAEATLIAKGCINSGYKNCGWELSATDETIKDEP
jgi:hypothetical protein